MRFYIAEYEFATNIIKAVQASGEGEIEIKVKSASLTDALGKVFHANQPCCPFIEFAIDVDASALAREIIAAGGKCPSEAQQKST
jgi:hypothetical protein